MSDTVYMLYDPDAKGKGRFSLGGGSSTPSAPRVYDTPEEAVRMRKRYFPRALVLPVRLRGGE
ncbi:hypothetical protein PBI_TOURACH_101 [Mycobacterium phage Tourach]|uniref:Uncharacterized protein n=1 Tax=Mycobacterium phage Tourach TaxID=2599882 RepID=A0A5J6TU89_9CAUD|nr:hypothetical protein J4T98_gp101 [Mycobacterium phage Tourach]QFG14336.1 hypothetical protein PBI_TOURACH_101 [Mycobacterium phage Tourach]